MVTSYNIKDTHTILNRSISSHKEYILTIRDLPLEKKPRERLLAQGPGALSISELLAVVFNTGTKNEDVLQMSGRIIREYGEKSIMAAVDATELATTLGIPTFRACQIVACGELGRRFYERNESGLTVIRTAKDVFEYLHDMRNLPKEHFRGLYLNTHHRIIHDEVISIGTINSNIVHPREVFRPAIAYGAVAVILAHNHPSNTAVASEEDVKITNQLIEAGKLIGINILDHVVITKDSFISVEANYL